MNLISKIRKNGLLGSARIGLSKYIVQPSQQFRHRNVASYENPSEDELNTIERDLVSQSVEISPVSLSKQDFVQFKSEFTFPEDYHGGVHGGVWDEKLLEHFIAYNFCRLADFSPEEIYLDVAASSSPWTEMLRTRGIRAYSVDLDVFPQYAHLDYYLRTDAKNMPFEDDSVSACSLQCAFEMFNGDDDWLFLKECMRVLKPGGVVVISPLYMHTHHCGYSTPDFYNKGFADKGAVQYINREYWGIPFSRKYSPALLKARVLDYLTQLGMEARLHKLENTHDLGEGIYCHFILVIQKPALEA